MKSLDANENKWIGNLRDDHLVHKKQLGVLILNDNTKIQNSIVEENVLILRVVREAINGPYVIIIRGSGCYFAVRWLRLRHSHVIGTAF